jgi:hypothetical protein
MRKLKLFPLIIPRRYKLGNTVGNIQETVGRVSRDLEMIIQYGVSREDKRYFDHNEVEFLR